MTNEQQEQREEVEFTEQDAIDLFEARKRGPEAFSAALKKIWDRDTVKGPEQFSVRDDQKEEGAGG